MQNIRFPDLSQRVVRITTPDVGKVTAALPDARPVQYHASGMTEIDVPWTLHHMTVLSQMLQPAVSTIFDGYTWPGRDRPFRHQIKIAEFLTRNPRAYCFAEMGTGKTRAALYATDYLMSVGAVRRALVVCPKSLLHSAWESDILRTCIHRTRTVLYGDRAQRAKLAERDTEIDIINFDGVEILGDVLKAKHYDLIVVDESTAYKTPSTKRWKSLAALVTPQTRIWALTGTPTPQGPLDAYGQLKLVTPDRCPRTLTAFRELTQYKVATFIWKNKRDWQATVRNMFQPAIYVRKADCLDLPPVTRVFRDVGLTKAQTQAVKQMAQEMVLDFDTGHQALAANAAVLHGKLRQIYAGAIYAQDGSALSIDNAARIEETVELVRRVRAEAAADPTPGRPHSKALVFVPFKHVMTVLADELKKHFDVAVISGDTTVPERKHILEKFQDTPDIDVILAIPEAFSHGVTATAASLTIWYAPPARTETYLQACERTDRPGQTRNQTIVHLYGDNRERSMYQSLIDNKLDQETLLQLYYDVIGQPKRKKS